MRIQSTLSLSSNIVNNPESSCQPLNCLLTAANLKTPYVSNTLYQHESTLRLICDAAQIPCMGNGTTAPGMSEFFPGN